MRSRDPGEPHRASTPLELLFDLCFVVAIAQAASRLHHGLAEAHYLESIQAYGLVFFAIWWAWMGFTWFASAYDSDDTAYRTKVFIQMAGALVLAAGVPRAFDDGDFRIITLGYCIMRVGLVAQWLRAARANVHQRRAALRYAGGITTLQLGWVALLRVPSDMWIIGWFSLVTLELLVPVWAERAQRTTWHPRHIAERYGLLTIIVIGESVLAATLAIQSTIDTGEITGGLIRAIVGGLFILFSMWWIYFDEPAHELLTSMRVAFRWGYAHLLVFASIAAVGAGLAVNTDVITHHAHLSARAASTAIAVPVALFLVLVWFLHVLPLKRGPLPTAAFLTTAILVPAATFTGWPVLTIGVLLVALAGVTTLLGHRRVASKQS